MSKYPEFKSDVRHYFRGPGSEALKGVEITPAAGACEVCRASSGQLFIRVDDVPRLPHRGCTCQPYGCRCSLAPVLR